MVVGIGALAPNIRAEQSVRAYVWVAGFVCATLYQFCWDITMDWGLLVPGSSRLADKSLSVASALAIMMGVSTAADEIDTVSVEGGDAIANMGIRRRPRGAMSDLLHWAVGSSALRKQRLLGPLWVYLAVMLANFLLRFAWTLTLLPPNRDNDGFFYSVLMTYLTPVIAAAEVLRRMVWGFLRLEWEHIEQQEKASLAAEEAAAKKTVGDALEGQEAVGEENSVSAPILQAATISLGDITLASPSTLTCKEGDTLDAQAQAHVEAEEEEARRELLLGPLERMATSGAGADNGGSAWLSWLCDVCDADADAVPSSAGGTTLYGAADPDGRFRVVAPILVALRTSLRLLLDGIACLLQRMYVVVAHAFDDALDTDATAADNSAGTSSTNGASSSNRGSRDGRFKRAFNGTKWIIAPLPRRWMQLIATYVPPCVRIFLRASCLYVCACVSYHYYH